MTDELNGLPNIPDLDRIAEESKSEKGQKEVSEAAAQNPPREELDLAQFKTPQDLLKSYKELQGFSTKASQERAQLKEEVEKLKQEVELARMATPQIPQYPQYQTPQQQPKTFDDMFIENPQAAIEAVVQQRLSQEIQVGRIQDILEEEKAKNPNEFIERYQYASQIGSMYPHLKNSSAGIRKLFELGDKYREENIKRKAHQALNKLVGADIDIERFKKLLAESVTSQQQETNKNAAYMPDTSMSVRTGADLKTEKSYDYKLKESVAKGDEKAVLDAIFSEAIKK